MIRRGLDRLLGPAVEGALRRLERGVSPDQHEALARRARERGRELARRGWRGAELDEPARALLLQLCEAPAAPAPCAPSGSGGGAPGLAALRERAGDEDALPSLALHLAALSVAAGAGRAAAAELGAGEAPPEPRSETPELAACALATLAGLGLGALPPAAARRDAQELAADLEPRRWFPRAGLRPGRANLLRTLLATEAGDAPRDYERDVCERLLRHVEVRRDEALRAEPGCPPWRERLEGLRFALALLDAAACFEDARFLNTALKLADRFHRELRRRPDRQLAHPLAALHYAVAIARQEALLRRLLACGS